MTTTKMPESARQSDLREMLASAFTLLLGYKERSTYANELNEACEDHASSARLPGQERVHT